MKHIKPTTDELQEGALKALEEAEKLKDAPTDNPPADLPAEPSQPPEEPQEEPKKEPEAPQEPEPSPAVDYRKKFTESTREAQILHARNKKLAEAIDRAGEISDPTEEEMQREYPEWEVMTESEKLLAKKNAINEKRFSAIAEAHREAKDIESWNDKVDGFLADPKSLVDQPELEGREEDFKVFATKPTRRGVDFADLVSAFLYDASKSVKPKKGQMFETGSGGPNDNPKPKSDKITIEEGRRLRLTDYKKYLEYLKAGKIEMENV